MIRSNYGNLVDIFPTNLCCYGDVILAITEIYFNHNVYINKIPYIVSCFQNLITHPVASHKASLEKYIGNPLILVSFRVILQVYNVQTKKRVVGENLQDRKN